MTPGRNERNGPILRELFVDGNGAVRVESVLVEGLAHAVPIRTDSASSCGQPGDFVVAIDFCAGLKIG
jgi:hypothetical protein